MTKKYVIQGPQIIRSIAMLQSKLGRSVSQAEFARMCGITTNALNNIIKGRSPGSVPTGQRMIDVLRSHGVAVDHEYLTSTSILHSSPPS